MYPKFIEVHELNDIRYADTHLVSVNVDNITFFGDKTIFVPIPDDDGYYTINVTESYEEIKQLIFDAGCIIAKKDPRLDDKPLTMDDLQGMDGEPVWNSNSRQWMLVNKFVGGLKIPDKHIVWMVKNNSQMEVMKEDDLIKFPLYRMKGGR